MLNLKPARRQAYRYGQQIRELLDVDNKDAALKVSDAYNAFLGQFRAHGEDDYAVTYLHGEFLRGSQNIVPLGTLPESTEDQFYIVAQ